MSQNRLPPPESEACLFRLRSSTQKGGTLIAEDVTDHATHERRICDPDGYRPPFCPRCGKRLHVHDYRERVLRAELRKPVALIVRLICVSCEAIWQILPLFIARHLWRTWNVERNALRPDHQASSPSEPQHWPKVPQRTVRRWRARWLRPALALAQILAVPCLVFLTSDAAFDIHWVDAAGEEIPLETALKRVKPTTKPQQKP